jgi:hypothetical protein
MSGRLPEDFSERAPGDVSQALFAAGAKINQQFVIEPRQI